MPFLKLRATYGFNGNAINANSLLTATYFTSGTTGLPTAIISAPPNPFLRWEKVKTINLAIDFSTRNNRISGTIEWYSKKGQDLLQNQELATYTGFRTIRDIRSTLYTTSCRECGKLTEILYTVWPKCIMTTICVVKGDCTKAE